jgi:hypothetical protein
MKKIIIALTLIAAQHALAADRCSSFTQQPPMHGQYYKMIQLPDGNTTIVDCVYYGADFTDDITGLFMFLIPADKLKAAQEAGLTLLSSEIVQID